MIRFHFFLTVVLLLCMGFSTTYAHVLGIDFGSEYIKVSGPHGNRGIDIVLNEMSQRKTDDFIGFRFGERYIGSNAKSLAARFPLQTATSINRLLSDPVSEDRQRFSSQQYEFNYDVRDNGTISVPISDPKGPFLAEELYAMLLSYTAQISLKDGVPDPKMAVITIPADSSFYYRESVNYAARLSGLKVLGLVESTTATAYYYGMRHRGFGNQTINLAIIDVGASHTEIGVFKISPPPANAQKSAGLGTIRKLSVRSDFSFGGRSLDLCIAELIQKEATKKLKIPNVIGGKSKEDMKAQYSLLRAAKRIRETLSVNSDTPYTVEGISGDRDYSSTFSRSDFEKFCGPQFNAVPTLLEKVMNESGISLSDLNTVELMGGVSRTPKLIADINKKLKKEVSRTLNMDEAAALGAGYYAAKISPFYHAKSFALIEKYPKNLYFSILSSSGSESVPRPLLVPESVVGDALSVTLNKSTDFTLKFFTDLGNSEVARLDVVNVSESLASVTAYDQTVAHPNNTHLIRIQFRLTEAGLLDVEEVETAVRYSVNVSSKEKSNVTDSEGRVTTVETVVPKTRVRSKNLKLSHTFQWLSPQFSRDAQMQSQLKLQTIDDEEREKHERAQSKNNLESYIFWAKAEGALENALVLSRLGESGTQQFTDRLSETQLWLEEEEGSEDSCPKAKYDEKLEALKALLVELSKTLQNSTEEPQSTATPSPSATDGDL